jgi:hypothetical protein
MTIFLPVLKGLRNSLLCKHVMEHVVLDPGGTLQRGKVLPPSPNTWGGGTSQSDILGVPLIYQAVQLKVFGKN